MKIEIKAFTEADIPFKVDLINNHINNEYLHYDLPLTHEGTFKWFQNKSLNDRYDAVVYINDVRAGVIGLINILDNKSEYYITLDVRGNGIGEEASKQLFLFAKQELNLESIYLYTEVKNRRAQVFFEKIGFKCEKRILSEKFEDSSGEDRLFYNLYLT